MNKNIIKILGVATTVLSLGAIGFATVGTVSAATAVNTLTNGVQTNGPMRPMMINVQRSVQNTSNGVTLTLTSTDPATVTKLQSMKQPPARQNSLITVTETNITNGVQITMSSTDAATITKLQTDAQNGHGFGFGMGGHNGGRGMFGQNIQRTATNTTNGVTITMTSTDAATVTKLQARPQATSTNPLITITQTNIANGIQITRTSTDAATITKLQTQSQHGHGFGSRGNGMGGMFGQNVQRTVTNTANGVTMTMTSTDAATVTKLQARPQPTSTNPLITVTQTNIANGIQITRTSTDAATITKLQQRAANAGHGRPGSNGNSQSGMNVS